MTTTDTRRRLPQNQGLAVRPLTAEVRSETDQAKAYIVTLPQCRQADGQPCPDFFYRRGNLADPFCKHLKAAMGLVGARPQTDRLDEDTAIELLIALHVRGSAAAVAIRRAKDGLGPTHNLVDAGIIGITYHPSSGVFDIHLS